MSPSSDDAGQRLSREAAAAYQRAAAFARDRDYRGTDPYDGLSSPWARRLSARRTRQAWIQAHKHAGSRLRRLTGVQPVRLAKGTALFASAAQLMGERGTAQELIDPLLTEGGHGPWGYEFDVQTRWAFYPAGSPNVIVTTYALRALRDCGALDRVDPAVAPWLTESFHPGGWFRYTPESDREIHNGSLLAAESLAMLGGDPQRIRSAVQRVLEAQRSDGSWAYGEGPGLEWVDSFHTVYVLDSLWALRDCGADVGPALERGLRFWREHCWDEAGLPLQFADQRRPTRDVHTAATVVGFLARAQRRGWETPDPGPAMRLLLEMQGADGGFRAGGRGPAHMRWNQAHAAAALAEWGSLR